MANTPRATTAGTQEVEGAENAGPLSPNELPDEAVRAARPELTGRRVRAIPYQNGSTVIVDKRDFEAAGISDQKQVKFDYRVDNFTVRVSDKGGYNTLTEEAAEFLTREHSTTFEYINE